MAKLFFSYSHRDEELRDQLETHLAMLKRQGVIEPWHDRKIPTGKDLDSTIDAHLEAADIVLFLVSSDFLASQYCYDVEMTRALQRHAAKEATVIPVILRDCDWQSSPLGKLRATPKDGKPIKKWADTDEAMLNVVRDIRLVADVVNARVPDMAATPPPISTAAAVVVDRPRSSNLTVRREFTQRDKDLFMDEGFEYMVNFFEGSLQELAERNSGIETAFKRVSATRFFATIYRHGSKVSEYTIYMGDMLGRGIHLTQGKTDSANSSNGSLLVGQDEHKLYWQSAHLGYQPDRNAKLTHMGASELYWAQLMQALQSGSY